MILTKGATLHFGGSREGMSRVPIDRLLSPGETIEYEGMTLTCIDDIDRDHTPIGNVEPVTGSMTFDLTPPPRRRYLATRALTNAIALALILND